MNVAVLVGAGASYGAITDPAVRRPPLGDELFLQLVYSFPLSWGKLPQSITKVFHKEGFEQGMAALHKYDQDDTQQALMDMSVYFASFRINTFGENLYQTLTHLLERFQSKISFSFVSLNYECLLEQSLAASGYQPYYWGKPGYLRNPLLVIKPHGSCNFLFDSGSHRIEGLRISGPSTYVEGPIKAVPIESVAYEVTTTGIQAAMSLYAPGKPDLICPAAIKRIRAAWQQTAMNAEAIIIIGARPIIADGHVWRPIVSSRAKIAFIGNDVGKLPNKTNDRFELIAPNFQTSLMPLRQWLERGLSD